MGSVAQTQKLDRVSVEDEVEAIFLGLEGDQSMGSVAQTQKLDRVSVEDEVEAISLGLEDPVQVPQPEEAEPPTLGEDPGSVAAEAEATCLGSGEPALAGPAEAA